MSVLSASRRTSGGKVSVVLPAFLICLLTSSVVLPNADADVNRISGIWDAVVSGEPRIFTVEIRSSGPSYAAMVVGHSNPQVHLFTCHDVRWQSERLRMSCEGAGDASNHSLTISGSGVVSGNHSALDVEFVLQSLGSRRRATRWRASLVNIEGNYFEYLVKMKELAGKAIASTKAKR